jgi:hypothetical protein
MTMRAGYGPNRSLIDLGRATRKTKGGTGFHSDDVLKREAPGLSLD